MDYTRALSLGPLVEDRPIGAGVASRLIDPLSRGTSWLGQWFRSPRFALIYAVWALPLTIMLAVMVPPFTNADEPFHMLRAVALAHFHVIGKRFDNHCHNCPTGSGGESDMAVFYAFGPLSTLSWLPNQPDGQVSASMLAASNAVGWQKDATGNVWFGSTAQYPPAFYVPDIAGYWIGRAAGLRVDATLCLCRCLNALTFVALAALAIARARRLRPILAALLMLPMTLALAASASQDAGIIATVPSPRDAALRGGNSPSWRQAWRASSGRGRRIFPCCFCCSRRRPGGPDKSPRPRRRRQSGSGAC
jgi:hypothetical protein